MDEDRIVDIFIIVAAISIIVLKIINVITIPWLWLTSIIWIPLCLGVILAIVLFIWYQIEIMIRRKK